MGLPDVMEGDTCFLWFYCSC